MGNRFEVWAWRRFSEPTAMVSGYEYRMEWRGESPWRAIWAMIQAKRTCGCVKIEWR